MCSYTTDVPKILDRITGVEETAKDIEAFCMKKKKKFLPIRDDIDGVLS